jgi:hypothetical protein
MWGLLELLWQAGKDQATILEMQAAEAEREGDTAKAAALQGAAEVLDAQAEQDAETLDYIHSCGM